MPRIAAPSLAEHRARQRRALLDAAYELLLDGGYDALTFGALAERAGLARPTVYAYFDSRDDVVAALCERELPRWLERVRAAMARARLPRTKVAAYVRTQLELIAEDGHRLAPLLMDAPLGPAAKARIRALHRGIPTDLAAALAELGVDDPDVAAALVQGIVDAATQQMATQAISPRRVIRTAVALALDGVCGDRGVGTVIRDHPRRSAVTSQASVEGLSRSTKA